MDLLRALPENVVISFVVVVALVVVVVPLSLRAAGLTGQQIQDVIALTLQFFINLVREYRAQNSSKN